MSGISVVIPARDGAATIAETLASVAAQTLAPAEIILVDDGSRDATVALARTACPAIRVIGQPPAGAAAASNAGIRAARGELIAMLDADDLWPPRRLEWQAAMLAADAGLVGAGGLVEMFRCPSLAPEAAARLAVPPAPMPSQLSTALLLRRAAFDAAGFYAEDLAAGFAIDWMHRARHAGLGFGMLERVVLRRRLRAGSLSAAGPMRDRAYLEMARRALARGRAP